jgi:DNA-binding transcriptional ArsR family regulator
MQELLTITKALADESRLHVLSWLRDGELCLCQIVAMLGLAPSTVSRHMSILVNAGLVQIRKDGKWTFYQLSKTKDSTLIRRTLKWIDQVIADDPKLQADSKRLDAIRKQDPTELCEITYGKSDA